MQQNKFGSKTLRLNDLLSLKLNVPKFIGIPADTVQNIITKSGQCNEEILQKIISEITSRLSCQKYAVRSSALIEDSEKSSFAGQFRTQIDVDKEHLEQAVSEVLIHAHKFLKGHLEKFSLLIQEYIEADFAGVTFTRNPGGEREMLVEYHKGRGEEIVGGKISPNTLKFYWQNEPNASQLPDLKEAVENFKKIETHFNYPQDIEWCILKNTWYFLQTRPITTISKEKYEEITYLEKNIPKDKNFYFEKTEISEIAPRPCEMTLDILRKIYAKDGPVENVYKKYKINYRPNEFLKIFGNELYCDKEEELKTLLPSFTYLPLKNFKPRFHTLKGIFTTLKNLYRLNTISLKDYQKLFDTLKSALLRETSSQDFTLTFSNFLKNYEIVFEINLLSLVATQKLESSIKKDKLPISILLNLDENTYPILKKFNLEIHEEKLIGNSIDIQDESKFIGKISQNKNTAQPQNLFKNISSFKKTFIEKNLETALIFNRLREFGRWLIVKEISNLRNLVLKIAERKKFKEKKNIFFLSPDEINQNQKEEICEKRKIEYSKYLNFNFPKTISSVLPIKNNKSNLGVSPDIAKGILIEEKDIRKRIYPNLPIILFTKILSPDLTQYFSKIQGIVSEEGGLLSHLAIMAREQKIPVIVNFSLTENKIKIGDKILLDATSEKITKI